ncbi:MAG: signal peptide peptidase SppA [Rhodospirillales bacterium]|nr:signal peptide peptidase SppA [Rhodospirillales bacterium]
MPHEADIVVYRRRMARRLTLWRVTAVLAMVGLVVALFGTFGDHFSRSYVARLDVHGVIIDDAERDEALSAIAADSGAKALIVHINSPGGTVVGGENLYHSLRAVAAEKPVVAVLGELATSAGYMAALGTDRIVARQSSLTGSIGVILQTTEITGLLEKLGITPEAIKSSPLKAQPSPLEKMTPEARTAVEAVIKDIYDMFVDMVAERRGLSMPDTLKVADGRIFTGRQAMEHGLVDAIGAEEEARAWLEAEHGVSAALPVFDAEYGDEAYPWSRSFKGVIGKTLLPERLTLDGLVSLWHPDLR